MKTAAILAVGTEITSGEILNSNSSWLATQLENLAIEVKCMLSVPDERQSILNALRKLTAEHGFVFVTGGLGPTSDDFTREVVAEFMSRPLQFSESSWQALTVLYQQKGLTLREAHRQQCYFPEEAEILENTVGTAHGFLCQLPQAEIFVLPGPPREVQGIFAEQILPRIQRLGIQRTQSLTRLVCLGVPESEVAEIVEETLKNRGLKLGYRASFPYVHVKVWHPVGETEWLQPLREKLQRWLVNEDDGDLAQQWLEALSGLGTVRVVDEATGGRMGARFEAITRKAATEKLELELVTYWGMAAEYGRDIYREPVDAAFTVHSDGQSQNFRVTATLGGQALSKTLDLPFKIRPNSERGRIYMTEHALAVWRAFLVKAGRGH